MNESIKTLGEHMVAKMRCINTAKKKVEYSENIRKFPIYSEFVGMIQVLKAMGIEYQIKYDDTVTEMTSITFLGYEFYV